MHFRPFTLETCYTDFHQEEMCLRTLGDSLLYKKQVNPSSSLGTLITSLDV